MVALSFNHAAVRAHRTAIDAKTALLITLIVVCGLSGLITAFANPVGFDEASFIAGL